MAKATHTENPFKQFPDDELAKLIEILAPLPNGADPVVDRLKEKAGAATLHGEAVS